MSDKPLSIRVPVTFLEEIDRFAAERNMNRKAFVLSCLQQAIAGVDQDTAMVASVDRMGEEMVALEGRLGERMAKGLAEINDRLVALETKFDELEEMHVHHLYNFLAHVAPDENDAVAAARGRRRLLRTIRTLDDVRSGQLKSLRVLAREEIQQGEGAQKPS